MARQGSQPLQRDYAGAQIQSRDTREIATPNIATPQFRPSPTISVGDSMWQANLIKDITGSTVRVLGEEHREEIQNRYLEGAAKVGQIESEAEIQGNPLSRDWEIAGYRDATNRILLADAEAQMKVDMASLREQSPEKMQEYLAGVRQKLQPALASGSREQRTANFAKLLTTTQSATKLHAAEHQAFIREVETKSLFTSWKTSHDKLADLRMKATFSEDYAEAYKSQLATAGVSINADIWANPKLTRADKESLTNEILTEALAVGSADVYEFAYNARLLNPDTGREDSIISRLSVDAQTKLSAKAVEVQQKNIAKTQQQLLNTHAAIEAAFDDPTKSLPTLGEIQQHANQLVSVGVFKEPMQYSGFIERYYKAANNRRDIDKISTLAADGNYAGLANLGISNTDALKAVAQRHARDNVPMNVRVAELLQIGRKGMPQALQDAGAMVGPLFMQLLDPEVPESDQSQAVLAAVSTVLGKEGTVERSHFLAGMSEEQRRFFSRMDAMQSKRGMTFKEAAAEASKEWQDIQKIGPQATAARGMRLADADATAIESYDSIGLLKGLWRRVTKTGTSELSPREDIWESNKAVVRTQVGMLQSELQAEVAEERTANPYAPSENVVELAASNMVRRTVPTKYNPFYVPRGQSPQKYFGVNAANETIGVAIENILGEPKLGGKWMLRAVDGMVEAVEAKDVNGQVVDTSNRVRISGDQMKAAINRLDQQKVRRERDLIGDGVTLKQGDLSIQFNGLNTANAPQDWMLDFRKNLVGNEGIRDTAYKDGKGLETIGIGIHSKELWPELVDGKATPEGIKQSFMRASNAAARAGAYVQGVTGFHNNRAAFLLFSEMSYQGGVNWFAHPNEGARKEYRDFVQALRSGDVTKATEAFGATRVGKASGKARVQHYNRLIAEAIKP